MVVVAIVAAGLCASVVAAMAQPAASPPTLSDVIKGFGSSNGAAAQPPSGTVSFTDVFDEAPDENWGPDDGHSFIGDGKFQFHVPAGQHVERYTRRYSGNEVDVQVDVVAAANTGASTSAGLVFWASASRDSLFLIDPIQGRFAVFDESGGKLRPVEAWKPTPELHVGAGKSNRIEVVSTEDEVDFLINGKTVDAEPGPDQMSGPLTGLYAASSDTGPGNYAFSNFSAHTPAPKAPSQRSAVAGVWDYISGPLSKPPEGGITFVGPPAPTGVGPGQTLFTDDFKTLDPSAWAPPDEYSSVQNGRYELHAPAKEAVNRFSNKYTVTDVDFQADVVADPETKINAIAGLSFWADGTGDVETIFEMDPVDGSFAVGSQAAGKWTDIATWRSTPLINLGAGKTNRMEVVAGHSKTFFLINGHQVAEMATPVSLPGSFIGLYAEGSDTDPGDFGFSNFSAKVPIDSDFPPGAVSAPATAPGQPIFTDDFKGLDPSWGVANGASTVRDGRMELTDAANDGTILVNSKYAYGEADVSTSIVEQAGGPDDAGGGLLFWSADGDDYVLFVVNPASGQFAVFRQDGDKSTTLIDWTNSSSLDVGVGKSNRIAVALRKDKAYLIINDHQVGEIPAPTNPPGSLIGIYGEGGQKAPATLAFSNFSAVAPAGEGPPAGVAVEAPPAARSSGPPAAVAAPTVAPGAVIFSDDFKTFDPSWGQPDDSSFVQNDRLELHSKAGRELDLINGKYAYSQADIVVTAAAEEGTPQQGAGEGLLFWAADPDSYTLFNVDPMTGNFAAFRQQGGKRTTLIDWRGTSLFNPGIGKVNRIGVGLRDGKALLMINGHQVGEIAAPSAPPGALIGLYSEGSDKAPGDIGYSDFSVAEPADGSLPPGTAAAPAAGPVQVIYSDDFKTLDPSWGTSSAATYVEKGRLELRSASNDEIDRINSKYAYSDADIETSVVEETGNAPGPFGGILFWAADSDNYTLFGVDPLDGKFAAFQVVDGKSVTLTDWTEASAIVQGVGEANAIGVILQGGQARLLINGQPVGKVAMPANVPGRLVGLYAGGSKLPGSFGYSDFVVKAPQTAKVASTAAPTTASATDVAPQPQNDVAPPSVQQQTSQHGTQSSPGSAHGVSSPAPSASPQNQASATPQVLSPASQQEAAPSLPLAPAALPPAAAASSQQAAAPTQMCPGQVVLEDDFKRMDPGWGKPDRTVFVTPNHAFGIAAPANRINGRIDLASRYVDADVCVESFLSATSDPGDVGGLAFWADDASSYYVLLITGDGRFGVRRSVQGASAMAIPFTRTSALKTGKNVANALEVSLRGDRASIIINGQQVGSFSGQPPAKGSYIGLQVSAQPAGATVWGFFHLVVSGPVASSQSTDAAAEVSSTAQAPPAAQALSSPQAPPAVQASASVSAASGPPACGGQMLYQDNFQTLDPSWGVADQSAYIQNGALMLAAGPGGTTSRINGKGRYGDFDVCVAAGTPLAQDVAGSAGLIFWASDPKNFYMLAVSAVGSYAVLRYADGQISDAVPWTSTAALKTGAGIWNQLEVTAVGNTASIAINGRPLIAVQGGPPANGSVIALIVAAPRQSPTTWAFGQLRIAIPTDAMALPGAPSRSAPRSAISATQQ